MKIRFLVPALLALGLIPFVTPASAIASTATTCPGGQVVTNSVQLTAALAAASPGTVIDMTSGTYLGPFTIKVSGTQAAPITLCGPRDAIIDGRRKSHAFYLHGGSTLSAAVVWWQLIGFQIQNGNKGLDLTNATHITATGLYIHNTIGASVHVNTFSSDNVFNGLTLRSSGAEGFYIGSAVSNWCLYSNCLPDKSDRNVIENSDVAGMTTEPVDIKEGTTGTMVLSNVFDGTTQTVKHDWVNAKGNGALIAGNAGTISPTDGYSVHVVLAGWGQNNTFFANSATGGPGYGFYIQPGASGTVVACGQTVSAFGRGYSNVTCH